MFTRLDIAMIFWHHILKAYLFRLQKITCVGSKKTIIHIGKIDDIPFMYYHQITRLIFWFSSNNMPILIGIFRKKQYTTKVQKMVNVIRDTAGDDVLLKKSPQGQIIISEEILRKNPIIQQ